MGRTIRGFDGVVAAVALLGGATAAGAQDLEAACEAVAGSTVGDWTEHSVTSPNGRVDMRFALVRDRGATWYEITSQTAVGPSILQLRVPGFPFKPAEIREVVVKSGTTPAVRLPDALVRQYVSAEQAGPLSDIRAACRDAEVIGSEEVSVAAGTFQTTRIRFSATGGEVWISDDVPFGIVRGDVPGQGTTELKAHGTGAVSSIREAPVSVPGTGGARSDSGQ